MNYKFVATCAAALCLIGSGFAQDAAAIDVKGKAIFAERCSTCHDRKDSRAPQTAYLAARLPSEIIYTLTEGEMVNQAAGLSAEDIKSLARFLTGREVNAEAPVDANRCTTQGTIVSDGRAWAGWGHDVHNTRFQREAGLTAADLPRLRVKWAFALPGLTGSPTVAGDHLYVTSRLGKLFSLDAGTGCTYWSYQAQGPLRNGVAIGALPNGRFGAYFGDQHAVVHALDAATGKTLWETKTDDYAKARVVGSVTYNKGVIYAPTTSADEADAASDPAYECCKFRGSVTAIDAKSGTILWKGYTVAEAAHPNGKNSVGTQLYGPSGAGVWSAQTVDEARGLIYAATGNSYTNVDTDATDAVVAFDIKSGRRVWASQVLKSDAWLYKCDGQRIDNCPSPQGPDFDFSSPPLLQTRVDGKAILVAGSKSGTVWAFDPDRQGQILWSVAIGRGSSADPIWGLAADNEKVYVGTPSASLTEGKEGGFSGIDLKSGRVVWRTESPAPLCTWGALGCQHKQMAAVTLIPGAAFSGSMDGHLRAYNTATGAVLWDFDSVQTWDAVNGVQAFGGNLDGSPVIVANGTVFLNAGNSALSSPRHGDAVLAITVDGK